MTYEQIAMTIKPPYQVPKRCSTMPMSHFPWWFPPIESERDLITSDWAITAFDGPPGFCYDGLFEFRGTDMID